MEKKKKQLHVHSSQERTRMRGHLCFFLRSLANSSLEAPLCEAWNPGEGPSVGRRRQPGFAEQMLLPAESRGTSGWLAGDFQPCTSIIASWITPRYWDSPVRCDLLSSISDLQVAPPFHLPPVITTKTLQTLPNVPWGAKITFREPLEEARDIS